MNISIPKRTGIFFDTETTGIPDWKIPSGDAAQPHMTQIAAVVADLDTRQVISSIDLVIRPDGWVIPQECVDLNGITTEYAAMTGVPEQVAVDLFLKMWNTTQKRFAFNTTFDNRIIRIATKRYFNDAKQDLWKQGEYDCQMIAARKHLGGRNPNLADAYMKICGKELVDAHTAMADTLACMEIYFTLQDHNT